MYPGDTRMYPGSAKEPKMDRKDLMSAEIAAKTREYLKTHRITKVGQGVSGVKTKYDHSVFALQKVYGKDGKK